MRGRLLTILAGLAAVGVAGAAAQTPAKPAYQLSCAALTGVEPPELCFVPPPEKPGAKPGPPVAIPVGYGTLPPPVELPLPEGGVLWERAAGGGGGWELKKFAEVPAARPGSRWVLLLYPDENGAPRHRFLPADDDSHPAGTVRILNLANSRLAATVDNKSQVIAQGAEALVAPALNPEGRFSFAAVSERHGQVTPAQLLRLRTPEDRMLIVFANQPARREVPAADGKDETVWQPSIVRLFDRASRPRAASAQPGAAEPGSAVASPGPAPGGPPARQSETPIQAVVWAAENWWTRVGAREIVDNRGNTVGELSANGPVELVLKPEAGERVISLRKDGAAYVTASLPREMRQPLLAAVGPVDESGSPKLLAFDNSLQSHPPGARRVFNLTPYQVAYSTGAGAPAAYVDPQEAQVMRESAGGPAPKFGIQTPSGWTLLGQLTSRPPGSGERRAVFVFPGAQAGKFELKEVEL